ncbi:hypothetical protein BRC90_00240 [Halobacteriales archaeon QS_4_69_34]|nr:MAG: hypothetical protein BRC90_00240 [Halobacteriales archaeon QS_4_69_34]
MSDFDKEAERERLEERFAEEQERRAETAHMSELLLQGATMTDTHCEDCGSPVFNYEGQAFCPTCQQDDGDGGTAGAADGPGAADAATATGRHEPTAEDDADGADHPTDDRDGGIEVTPDTDADVGGPAGATVEADGTEHERGGAGVPADRVAGSDAGNRREPPSQAAAADYGHGSRDRARRAGRRPGQSDAEGAASGSESGPSPRGGAGGEAGALGAAEESLARTLNRLATAAEEGSDLGRTRERLAAAREAAEALAAVRQAGR